MTIEAEYSILSISNGIEEAAGRKEHYVLLLKNDNKIVLSGWLNESPTGNGNKTQEETQ